MSGVMDINHLLCYPNIKSDLAYQESSFVSFLSSPTSPATHQHCILPLPANFGNVDFWRHNRSMSSRSSASNASSCTTSSGSSSSSSNSTPIMPALLSEEHQQQQQQQGHYRRRVNSESDSAKFLVHVYPIQSQQTKSKSTKRARSNSASYIQTRVPWTPEEDDLLQKGYEQGLSWAMISCTFLPHRSRGCCWGRFKTLQSKNAIEVYQQRICQRPWRAHFKK